MGTEKYEIKINGLRKCKHCHEAPAASATAAFSFCRSAWEIVFSAQCLNLECASYEAQEKVDED